MKRQLLADNWLVREEPLSRGPEAMADVLEAQEGWMPAKVPTDVRVPLIEAGRIQDPVEALACFDSEWVEERSWWFKTTLDADADLLEQDTAELVLESIDAAGDVFLNGRHLGHHQSAFYPFTAEVSGLLRPAGNVLVVRVTVGAEVISQEQAAPFKTSVNKTHRRGDERRVFLRKPQYVFGWDWGPRIATCGLVKDVYLRAASRVAARSCSVETVSAAEERATLRVVAEVDNLHAYETREAVVEVAVTPEGAPLAAPQSAPDAGQGSGARASRAVLLSSGTNAIEFDLTLENPKLWWPNGVGPQNLYTVSLSVSAGDVRDDLEPFQVGIRTLELDTSQIGGGDRMFRLLVNGRPVFCRGGNWVPADSVYARVTDAKYEALIAEAAEAGFTMLRIWGGGIYEREVFYDLCDRIGVLVWHDFMFACALYPDDRDWFRREAEREIDYQTRRLRSHACLALWSGNNENHWGLQSWWVGERQAEFAGGAAIYNYIAPRIIRSNCPHIPYWRSSPYGGADPNGNAVGDRHHWHDCTMNPDMEKRITPEEYDKVRSKFVSEYGYIGPCARASIEQYHAGEPVRRHSELWNWHNNTFEKDTVVAGIAKHYVDTEGLTLDDYLLYAGLVQGLMYGYSLESIRCAENCWGSLFWMYNDCWGEVGWTIIDYYLRRKPSYYYVKRAFSPVKLVLRRSGPGRSGERAGRRAGRRAGGRAGGAGGAGGQAVVYGANDTRRDVELAVEYGYAAFDGSTLETERDIISLPASSKGPVFRFDLGGHDERVGAYYVRPAPPAQGKRRRVKRAGSIGIEDGASAAVEPGALTALLRSGPFRSLEMGPARLEVSGFRSDAQGCGFTVSTDVFAHAVHFGIEEDWRLSDAYFDLLPGESRQVRVLGPAGARPTPAAGMEETREAGKPMADLSGDSIRPRSVVVR